MSKFSYGDTTMKESFLDTIMDLNAEETYVTSNANPMEVNNKVHSWNEDPIVSATSATTGFAIAENVDTTYTATNPTLKTNFTQIIERGFKVSATDENAKHYGMDSAFAREQMKKMKEWKNLLEIAAVVGTQVSGTGTAARTMQGFVRFGTLATAQSGVSLTSDMLNEFLGNAYDAGGEHDTILVGRVLKSRISSFTVGNTRNINAADGKVYQSISVYESDNGTQKVIKHRFINQAAANTYNVLATYLEDYVKIGFLDNPHFEERPSAGYYKAGAIVGEGTVALGNALAAQLVRGLL